MRIAPYTALNATIALVTKERYNGVGPEAFIVTTAARRMAGSAQNVAVAYQPKVRISVMNVAFARVAVKPIRRIRAALTTTA